jgi:hypothetical protein
MKALVEIIEDVVDQVASLPVVSAIEIDGGITFTILLDKRTPDLWVGAKVNYTFLNDDREQEIVEGVISSIASNRQFNITLESVATNNVVSLELIIQFIHGHLIDVIERLAIMSKDPTVKDIRFPLFILPQDISEPGSASFNSEPKPSIIICTDTKVEFSASERYDNSFDISLYNLAKRFLKMLELSEDVYFRKRNRNWIDRLYWGREAVGGNEANKLNDFVDGIELQELEIKVLQNC